MYYKKSNILALFFLLVLIVFFVNSIIILKENNTKFVIPETEIFKEKINEVSDEQVYLFLGDSITDFYDLKKYYGDMESYKIINSGISGDKTYQIMNDIENRVFKYNPDKIVLLIGINQVELESVETVSNSIIDLINKIQEKLPNTFIYLESLYPINSSVGGSTAVYKDTKNVIEINKKIESFAANNGNVMFIDMYQYLRNNESDLDRNYTEDGLHLNEKGYQIVTDVLKQIIFE